MAEVKGKVKKKGGLGPLLRGFRPAVPATVGAFALTFLFAAMMPMPWIASICWNLYLDTIHPIFMAPLGNTARVAIALAIAVVAALLAMIVALALVKPAVKGNKGMNQRVAARARQAEAEEEVDSQAMRRRRVDGHPDAPPVAPISAERDLPAGGLGPVLAERGNAVPSGVSYGLSSADEDNEDEPFELGEELVLDQSNQDFEGDKPVASGPVPSVAVDNSLGAMVARFEEGLGRRKNPSLLSAPGIIPTAANEQSDPAVDLALEAALSTLQRMSKSAVG